MSNRLPKLSFVFPEVEDFLRSCLSSTKVNFDTFISVKYTCESYKNKTIRACQKAEKASVS